MTFDKNTVPILWLILIALQACSRIRFGVYAELTVFPVDTVVEVGGDVRLNCTSSSNKPVNWQHGKDPERMAEVYIGGEGLIKPYSKSRRHSMDEDTTLGRYDLIIESVSKEDEGIYVCSEKASRDKPPHARLTVTGVVPQPSCPSYEIYNVGEEAKLEFSTCAIRPFYMSHTPVGKSLTNDVYDNGKLLNDYATSGRFRIDDAGGSCLLYIVPVHISDAGTYSCLEKSGLGQNHDKDLIVRDETCDDNTNDITSRSGENEDLEGNCTLSFFGHRNPLISWMELNCNGSICSVKNVTSGTSQFCKMFNRTSEGFLVCEMVTPTLVSILLLRCEFSCESGHNDIHEDVQQESRKWIGLLAMILVIFLLVLMSCLSRKYIKKWWAQRTLTISEGTTCSENLPFRLKETSTE